MTFIEKLKKIRDDRCSVWTNAEYEQGFLDAIQRAIEIYRNHNDWIPVSQPPKKDGTYLVQTKFNNYEVLDYHNCCNRWEDDYAHERRCVVAWQPLPKPYKHMKENKQ